MLKRFLALTCALASFTTPLHAQQATAQATLPKVMMLRWFVADVSRGERFYSAVFGAKVVQTEGEKVRIMMFPGGAMPGLILIESPEEKHMNGSFVIQVADLKATLALAAANGGKLMNTRFADKIEGLPAQSSHFADPDGNIIEVLQIGPVSK